MKKAVIGQEIYKLTERLFPLDRFLMGEGVRDTLKIIKEYLPQLAISHVPSGTSVFDWTIPEEWIIRKAYIENEGGGENN